MVCKCVPSCLKLHIWNWCEGDAAKASSEQLQFSFVYEKKAFVVVMVFRKMLLGKALSFF